MTAQKPDAAKITQKSCICFLCYVLRSMAQYAKTIRQGKLSFGEQAPRFSAGIPAPRFNFGHHLLDARFALSPYSRRVIHRV